MNLSGASLTCVLLLVLAVACGPQGKPLTLRAPAIIAETEPEAHRVDEIRIGDVDYLRREIRANSFTRSTQGEAGLAMGPDCFIMVTWGSRRQRNGMTGVYYQRFDSAGRRIGTETGAHNAFEKVQHALVSTSAPQPWLAWESFDKMREGGVLFLGRGQTKGVRKTTRPTRIGTGQANSVTLLAWPDGGVLAVFVQLDEFGRPSVWQQRFDAGGSPIGRPDALAAGQRGTLPVVARHGNGGYVIAWAVQDAKGLPAGLAMRRFDRASKAVGALVHISGRQGKDCIEPGIASFRGGDLVLVWHDRTEKASYYDVLAQRFDRKLAPVGETITVATATVRLSGACVAATPFANGRFCVAWNRAEGDAINQDVFARIFERDGRPRGAAFHVCRQIDGDQSLATADNRRRIAFGPAGELAFAWSGNGDLGDSSAAHLTLLLPKGHTACAAARDARPERLVAAAPHSEPGAGQIDAESETAFRPHDPPVFLRHLKQARGGFTTQSVGDPGFVTITDTGWRPPDPHIAIGPNHLVAMANSLIAFFKKDGTRTFAQATGNAGGFWGSLGAKGWVFDPRVVFDAYSGRFVAIAIDFDLTAIPRRAYFCIAVSDDDDPNGKWHKYRFDITTLAGGYIVDYPHVGIDKTAIYIAVDNFNTGSNHMMLIFDKAPMLNGQPLLSPKVIHNSATLHGALGAQRGNVPACIMVTATVSPGSWTSLELHAFRNSLTSPVATKASVTVPAYSHAPLIPQLGSTAVLRPVSTRIIQVAVRNKRVFAIHTVGKAGRGVVRWYEFDLQKWPASGGPRLVQTGDIDEGTNVHTFLPGIAVDIYGNSCACYSRSGPNDLPSIGRAYRKANDPLGTMSHRVISITSTTPYSGNRWGDYSSVVVDPRDQATFWYCHEYATASYRWNTWSGHVRVQRPTLTADKTRLSASTGGTLTLSLDNPPYAGQTFIMVTGWSGTSPGLRLPSPPGIVNLDVNFDILTSIMLSSVNTPTFQNFFGRLDASGRATSVFRLPAIPSLMGHKLHFAFAQGYSVLNFASETVDLDVIR